MIISQAYAQAAPAPADGGGMTIIMIVVMFAIMYFLIIRPQQKRAKETKTMIDALQKGDEVITAGGIVGRITRISDQYLTLEIAAGTEIVCQRAAIQAPLPKGTIKTLQQ